MRVLLFPFPSPCLGCDRTIVHGAWSSALGYVLVGVIRLGGGHGMSI